MVNRFQPTLDISTVGFHTCVRVYPETPVAEQLRRRRLFIRKNRVDIGNPSFLRRIIDENSSLRVDFGWSFESTEQFQIIVDECIQSIFPNFSEHAGLITTDSSISWLGFVPHNSYDREIYKDLNVYELICFNNDMIDFQESVINFFINHPIYLKHIIIRDSYYRFEHFKKIRKDRVALTDAYHFYMNALTEVGLLSIVPRDIIEEQIGCHYLYEPDLFFELLDFSLLKGDIYG